MFADSETTVKQHRSVRLNVHSLDERVMPAADIVIQWNNVALEACTTDLLSASPAQGGPTKAAWALGIVQSAVYNAAAAIDGTFTLYRGDSIVASAGASFDAAVSQAAHDTLVDLYPAQRATIDAALTAALAKILDGKAETDGIALGSAAADAILAERANDHSRDPQTFTPAGIVGHWAPDPTHPSQTALGPQWGNVTPFTMTSSSQFRAPPPPALTSPEYTAAYNELLALGGDGVNTPTQRTAEQTEIGLFWAYDGAPGMCTPPRLYNQVLQQIAEQQHNTPMQNARLFALANLAMADAGIAGWETKYYYDLWRPIGGIRAGDLDGNPDTIGDPNWTPLGAPFSNGTGAGGNAQNFTPPFPAYVSGHATFGAALFQTLSRFYGTDSISFTLRSDELNGVTKGADGTVRPDVTRSFTSFSQAAVENARSRIYLGIHWAFDATEGVKQGTAIANQAYDQLLRSELTGDERYVTQLYRALLGRNPDAAGLAEWSGRVGTEGREFVAGRILASSEYHGTAVQGLYRQLLGRDAEVEGLQSFTAFLDGGGTMNQARAAIMGSAEYFAQSGSIAGFVDSCYEDLLGRTADAEGRAAAIAGLSSLRTSLTREQFVAGMCEGTEYCGAEIQGAYTTFLNRSVEDDARNAWVAGLQHERFESVLARFLASAEYQGQA